MMEQRECPRASLTYGKTLASDRRVDWNGWIKCRVFITCKEMEDRLLITSPLWCLYCWAWVRFCCSLMIYIKEHSRTGNLTHLHFQQENSGEVKAHIGGSVKADIGESLSWTKKKEESKEKSKEKSTQYSPYAILERLFKINIGNSWASFLPLDNLKWYHEIDNMETETKILHEI